MMLAVCSACFFSTCVVLKVLLLYCRRFVRTASFDNKMPFASLVYSVIKMASVPATCFVNILVDQKLACRLRHARMIESRVLINTHLCTEMRVRTHAHNTRRAQAHAWVSPAHALRIFFGDKVTFRIGYHVYVCRGATYGVQVKMSRPYRKLAHLSKLTLPFQMFNLTPGEQLEANSWFWRFFVSL